jgi:hypothetical protein
VRERADRDEIGLRLSVCADVGKRDPSGSLHLDPG